MIYNSPKEELEYYVRQCAIDLKHWNTEEKVEFFGYKLLEEKEFSKLTGLLIQCEDPHDQLDFMDDTSLMIQLSENIAQFLKTKNPQSSNKILSLLEGLAKEHYRQKIQRLIRDQLDMIEADQSYSKDDDYYKRIDSARAA